MIVQNQVCDNLSVMICTHHNTHINELKLAFYSSCVFQFLLPSEVIIVKDGPVNEKVVVFIEYLRDVHNVTVISTSENFGHGNARNLALRETRKEWMAIVDSDDFSFPSRFLVQMKYLKKHPNVSVLGGGLVEFEVFDGAPTFNKTRRFPESASDVLKEARVRCPIAQPTVVFRVDDVRSVGGYLHWHNNEDYFLWIRLLSKKYVIQSLPDTVIYMKFDLNSVLRRRGIAYWWNEVALQWCSYKLGTTTLRLLFFGILVRLMLQVVLPARILKKIYKTCLR